MRHIIAHGHMFKNAGSSLDWALSKSFGSAFCDHRDDSNMRKGGSRYLESFLDANSHLQALSSHHLCNTDDVTTVTIHPMYLIRHPIERVLSVYNFERLQEIETLGSVAAKKYTFKDYVKWRMEPDVPMTIRNFQTAYILSKTNTKNGNEISSRDIPFLAEKISKTDCVGLVDQFDESLCLFETKLKPNFPNIDLAYIRQNSLKVEDKSVQHTIVRIAEQISDIFDLLIEKNTYDLLLYEFAREKLAASMADTKSFDKKLKSFKKRCATLIKKADIKS